MSWVVLDSEDEGESIPAHKPPLQTHSSISDFSTREIILPETPKADNTSMISEFTDGSISKVADTTTETIVNTVASTNAALTKSKRPRPRPAYGRVLPDGILSNLSTSIATVSTTAINEAGAGPSHYLQSEPSFSLEIAEKTRSHKRSATADDAKTAESAVSRNSHTYNDTILESSSKDTTVVAGKRRRKTQKPKSKTRPMTNSTVVITLPAKSKTSHFEPSPSVPSPSVNHVTRLPSPVQERINVTSTPPSSPFQPRRKKRRAHTTDFDYSDDSAKFDRDTAASSTSVARDTEPRAKKRKLDKEKKSCVNKPQVVTEGGSTSIEIEAGEGMEAEIRSYNQRSPSPKERTEKNAESASKTTPQGARPQTSTPKMPSRRDSMSALIRRVSSKVQSPLGTPSPAYSPLAKASRTILSRIAPLHPNRRTPPPPPPRPPAPKKSKKMLELEEKWEEELAETVEGWSCMTDEERAALRRAKRDVELGYDD